MENSSQASKLERDSKRKSLIITRVTSETRWQMILKFLHNLLWSIFLVHLVFDWIRPWIDGGNRFILLPTTAFCTSSCKITQISAQFVKKLFDERVNKKFQKIKGTFLYKLAKFRRKNCIHFDKNYNNQKGVSTFYIHLILKLMTRLTEMLKVSVHIFENKTICLVN